ncbi:MAG: DUF4364 family protein [Nitrososphaerales archaeon]
MEIHVDIMKALTEDPKNPTRVMYTTNITWLKLQECLNLLIKNGLVQEVEGLRSKRYAITQKGREAIGEYTAFVKELMPLPTNKEFLEL